ncbi:MAG: cytochrome P450 [Acidobacteria bacterium]|jgi:cytochrome P450|nr:cytochrome P450 [Acidobacteriota bacterium]
MKAIPQSSFPPSVKANWIGGHFLQFRRNPTEFLQTLAKLGDVTFFKMGGQSAYLVNHPDLARDLLVAGAHKFIKGRALQRAKTLLGEGLLTSEGESHLRQRRMIQPAFHREKIKSYAEAMTDFAAQMANDWQDGEVRDVDREMMHLTLQIVGKTLFSANVEDDASKVGEALTTLIKMFSYLLLPFSEILEKLPIPHARRFNRAKETLDAVIYEIINERRKSGEDKGDLLSMLLLAQDEDDGGGMTDRQVRDECLTLFLAGHETTANALVWTFYCLSQNPESEAKLHEELDRVLQNGRAPTVEDLPNLKYTESVLAESMRLFPPAWVLGRLAIEEHEIKSYKIPKGALVLASMYVLQRDARFWTDAEIFKPERWETQSIKEAGQKFIYFPFGAGVRRCVGEQFAWMEGILLLATLARKWKLSLTPEQKIGLQPMMTLRPKFGMKMRIQKR